MKKIDLKNINKYDIYTGNIMLVTYVSHKILEEIKRIDGNIEDFSVACSKVLAKEEALLIKVNSTYFVDLDMIKSTKDIDYINYCLENKITDNILLRHGTFKPFVGQLYLTKLCCLNKKKQEEIKRLILK